MNVTLGQQWQVSEKIIDDDQLSLVNDIFSALWILFAFTGIATNAINIKTFATMGLEDGVSVTFFALSCSDFGFSSVALLIGVSSVFNIVEEKYSVVFPIQPFAVMVVGANVAFIMYATSGMTTLFLAVVRCMCVAKPLHFKNVFTKSRSVHILSLIAVLALICYIPLLTQTGTERRFDPSVNRTRMVLWMSDIREKVKDISAFIIDTVFTTVAQVVIVVCVIIMAECLRRSGQFRQATLSTSIGNPPKLSGKEIRIVRQVVLISIIYIVCTLPKVFNALYSLVEIEFDIAKTKKLRNLYVTMSSLRTACELINSASTFPIYYLASSRFKATCRRKHPHLLRRETTKENITQVCKY